MSETQNIIRKSFDFSIESLLRTDKDKRCKNEEVAEDIHEDQLRQTSFDTSSDLNETSLSPKSEIAEGTSADSLETFSWLHCTRFKPPKLPRSRKRGTSGKRLGRGPRIPFSPHQIAVLENTFSNSQYLSSECINRLANALHLSETRVKIWFQNRRARFRREKDTRDCQELSCLGSKETKLISPDDKRDKEDEDTSQQNKSHRKRANLMTSPSQYLAFQIQSRRDWSMLGSAGIPGFSYNYKTVSLEHDFLKASNYSITDAMDFPLFHRPHPPLINDPMFSDFEFLSNNNKPAVDGSNSLAKISEDRLSTTSSSNSIVPSTFSQQFHQPRIY